MKPLMKPTTKNSPQIHMAKDVHNEPAEVYAKPHKMTGEAVHIEDAGFQPKFEKKKNWVPLDGPSITTNGGVKTDGIKIRGTGAAIKGVMARGPMA